MPIPQLSPQQLKAALDAGETLVVLDVREAFEVSLAPFPGAVHIPMGQIVDRMDQELDPDARIVVLCHHGVRSWHVAMLLHARDFSQVENLSGGIDRWSLEIDPGLRRY